MQDLNNVHAKPLATLQVEVNNNSVWLHFRESCVSLETHTACERQVTRARNAPCFVAFLVCVCMLLLWVLWVHSINWEKGQKRKTSALLCFLIPCDATAPVQSRSCTHNAHNISCKNKLNFFTLKPRHFSRHLSLWPLPISASAVQGGTHQCTLHARLPPPFHRICLNIMNSCLYLIFAA